MSDDFFAASKPATSAAEELLLKAKKLASLSLPSTTSTISTTSTASTTATTTTANNNSADSSAKFERVPRVPPRPTVKRVMTRALKDTKQFAIGKLSRKLVQLRALLQAKRSAAKLSDAITVNELQAELQLRSSSSNNKTDNTTTAAATVIVTTTDSTTTTQPSDPSTASMTQPLSAIATKVLKAYLGVERQLEHCLQHVAAMKVHRYSFSFIIIAFC